MLVRILTDGGYSFGEEFIGQVLPAEFTLNGTGVVVTFPRELGDTPDDQWLYSVIWGEVEVVEE